MFSLVLSHSSSGAAKHKWHHHSAPEWRADAPMQPFCIQNPISISPCLVADIWRGSKQDTRVPQEPFTITSSLVSWNFLHLGRNGLEEASDSTTVLCSLTESFLPPHPAVQGVTCKKNYVLNSFPFLCACEEVVDSSTFFESNQEYPFFLESLLPGMNAKELVLLLSCDWSWITLNCFCSFIGHAGWILVRVIKLLPWQKRNSSWVAGECHRNEIWECCRTTVSVFPDNQEKTCVGDYFKQEAEQWALRICPQGFWAPQNPNHVWGLCSEQCQGMLCMSGKVILLGLYQMDWYRATQRREIQEP